MDRGPKQKAVKGGMIMALGVGFLARQAQCQAILDPLEMMVGWTRLTMTRRTLGTMAGGKGEHQDWRAQGHGNYGWSDWGYQSWHSKEYEPPESWDTSSEVFLPEFLVGFLLLHRSGLDTHERANVLAAIRGEFSPQTVAKALREQWSDDDLNKRDRAKFGAAMTAVGGEDEELEALMVDDDDHFQDLSHEDQQAYMLEQSRVDEALAAIQTQKTTLKEARWKQKQLKLGRGYFPPKPYQRPGPSGGSTKKPVGEGCFKCGGPHLARDCPKKMEKEARVSEEAAEIAFGVTRIQEDDNLYGSVVEETAMEAVEGEQVLRNMLWDHRQWGHILIGIH